LQEQSKILAEPTGTSSISTEEIPYGTIGHSGGGFLSGPFWLQVKQLSALSIQEAQISKLHSPQQAYLSPSSPYKS
jgi:hypothetical protein